MGRRDETYFDHAEADELLHAERQAERAEEKLLAVKVELADMVSTLAAGMRIEPEELVGTAVEHDLENLLTADAKKALGIKA